MKKQSSRKVIRTPRDIDRAQPGDVLRDPKSVGLYLIVAANSRRSWILRYRGSPRADGRAVQRAPKLGEYPAMSLAEARTRAAMMRGAVLAGKDPMLERQETRRKQAAEAQRLAGRISFGVASGRYLASSRVKGYKTPEREAKLLDYLSETVVHGRPLRDWAVVDITAEAVAELQEALTKRGPVLSNRCMRALSRFDRWARRPKGVAGMAERPPLTAAVDLAKERSRERVLTDAEIAAVWNACDAIGVREGALIKLLLMTSLRGGEIQRLQWRPDPAGKTGHVDLQARVIDLPGAATKNGDPLIMHLSEPALAAIRSLPRHFAGPFVFSHDGRRAPTNLRQKAQAQVQAASGTSAWCPHDLRRTVATGMQRLGIARPVIDSVLNHRTRGVAGIYMRFSYAQEKRAALDSWAKHVLNLAAAPVAEADEA